MHTSVRPLIPRSTVRRLVLLPALVVGLGLAFAGAAHAQAGFQASVTGAAPKPKPCSDGAFFCGTAMTKYGPAAWSFSIVSDAQVSDTCAAYEATVTFALAGGSKLVLDENGTACQPGHALSAPGGLVSFGNPFTLNANWTVQRAYGRFGSTTGSGTDTLHAAGAHVSGTYSQTL